MDKEQEINKHRGEFIGEMVMIEIILSKVLATYIAPDKMNYCEFMLSKMDMQKKLDLYKQVLKDKEPSFVKYTYKEMLNDIKEMQDVRNLFAHSMADIHFFGYKNGKKTYSEKISFKNAKNMERDFMIDIAAEYELKDHKKNIDKFNKIRTALFNVLYHYNGDRTQ